MPDTISENPSTAIGEIKIHLRQMKEDIHELREQLHAHAQTVSVFSEDLNKAKGAFRTISTVSLLIQGFAATVIAAFVCVFCSVVYPSMTNGIADHIEKQVGEQIAELRIKEGVNESFLQSASSLKPDVESLRSRLQVIGVEQDARSTKIANLEAKADQTSATIAKISQSLDKLSKIQTDLEQAQLDILAVKNRKK